MLPGHALRFMPGTADDSVDKGLDSNHAVGGKRQGRHDGEEYEPPHLDQDHQDRHIAAPVLHRVVDSLP